VLRVRPPVVDAVREVAADVEFGGRRVARGTTVMVIPTLVHTRAEAYDEPYTFRPERFLGRRPSPAEWVPFGGGVRRCLGAALAQQTLKALLRVVLEQAELRPAAPRLERARLNGTTLVPIRGGRVVVATRVAAA
jgi:cytochrome P450